MDIKETLRLHKMWLDGIEGGVRANLSEANLSEANLSRVDLSGCYLSGADLSRADLSGADLSRVDLSGCYLSGADLSRADLSGADLSRVDLSGCYLSGADLSGADLSGANLDYSVWPLWCGSLSIGKTDEKQMKQLTYHLLRAMDACDDPQTKKIRNIKSLIKYANGFHRVDECGIIKEKKK